MKKTVSVEYDVTTQEELSLQNQELLNAARKATGDAYAPYSGFKVGAAALLDDESIITGSNQENASFPAGICAERVLLSAISATKPGATIKVMAISYVNTNNTANNSNPVAPCGVCRQSLLDYEQRQNKPMEIIFAAREGEVILIENAGALLPFAFDGSFIR